MSENVRREPPERLVKAALDVLNSTKNLLDNASNDNTEAAEMEAVKVAKKKEANRKKKQRQRERKRELKSEKNDSTMIKESPVAVEKEIILEKSEEEPLLTDVISIPLQFQLSEFLKVTPLSVTGKIDISRKVAAFVSADQTHLLAFGRLVDLDSDSSFILDLVGPVALQERLVTELKAQEGENDAIKRQFLISSKSAGEMQLKTSADFEQIKVIQ